MSHDWEKRFLSVIDKHEPFCQRKVRNCHAPYIDKDLRHKMVLRDLHKKRFKTSRNTDEWQKFKKLRNEVNSLKSLKKRSHYLQKLEESRGDVKGTWEVNGALGKKPKSATINALNVNGKEIFDPKEIAHELNSYFCSTAKRVQSEDPAVNKMDATPNFEFFIKNYQKPAIRFDLN